MSRTEDLRQFLRSRRAALEPPEVGLSWSAVDGRRVPGLKREELALVAGISVDYYARLEQGRARNVSDQVVDSLANALKLADVERSYLRELTRPSSRPNESIPRPHQTTAALRTMITALDPTPALLYNDVLDVLGLNRMATILFDGIADLRPPQRNLIRWAFLDPRARMVLCDWDEVAELMTASLRSAAGSHDEDPELTDLVGQLSLGSDDFVRLWARHRVSLPHGAPKFFFHPLVGQLDLHYQSLAVPDEPGQYVALYTPQPGSLSAERLSLLSAWNTAATENH